jgi:hypothetical protein
MPSARWRTAFGFIATPLHGAGVAGMTATGHHTLVAHVLRMRRRRCIDILAPVANAQDYQNR